MKSSAAPRESTSLIGKAKELQIASDLVAAGLYVFFPFVDAGFDLVVTNRRGTMFIPIQVKFRANDPALGLKPDDRATFDGTKVVLAWVIGIGDNARRWFIPYGSWEKKAVAPPNRKDGLAYVTVKENELWLKQFEGCAGIRKTFALLLE